MSTRVHELAKELGLQSKDLLDRITEWGLPVKSSIFAGLDEKTVEEIRRRHQGGPSTAAPSASPPAPASNTAPAPAAKAKDRATSDAAGGIAPSTETLPIRPPAPAPAKPADQTAPASSEPPARVPAAPAGPVSASPSAVAEPARSAPPQAPSSPKSAPAEERSRPAPSAAAPAPPRPSAPDAPAPSGPSAPAGGGSLQSTPRPGGLSSPPRPAAGSGHPGPLSRHTHRTGGAPPTGGGAPAQPRPQQPAPPQSRQESSRSEPPQRPPVAGNSPQNSPAAPHQRGDYISPTGSRAPLGRPLGPASQQPQYRRPDGDGGDGPRPRDRGDVSGPRRPLPPVAQSNAPPSGPRRPDSRPPGRDEVKTQRPEMKFTREQLLQMRQSGELGGGAPAPARPGMPPHRPGSPPPRPGVGGAGPRFPSQPAGGNQRPPMPPAGGPAPLARRPGAGPLAPPPAPPTTTEEEDDRKGKGRLGSAADRAGRRVKRDARATERRVTSPLPASALISEDDDSSRNRGPRRGMHKLGHRQHGGPQRKSHAEIEPPISVRTLSEAIGIKAADLIRKMMTNLNQLVTINQTLEEESAQMLALEFGVELEIVRERTAEDELLEAWEADEEGTDVELVDRPPVVTILGHVDHGKTSLLDRIRRTNVVAGESGGITQHIGAYQVEHEGKLITFVDTPGHEAFTEMRARGANVTDIVVLVVAADDGVMPQTVEAISHAKAADVPIIIALNKIDLPNVNINRIYGELSQQGLVPEEYGGDTPVVKTSATQGVGIADLLEMIGIVAELKCVLKANPKKNASGTCLEALISEGRGAVARVIVQDGTLRVGDVMVCGDGFGRVRALYDDKGRAVEEAGPSAPVEVSGLDAVPTAGEKFGVVDDIGRAREIAETRRERMRGVSLGERQAITLENLFESMAQKKVKSLNVILKADVQGSLEALTKELEKLVNPEVPIRVLHKAVGGISESDILLADASQAIVIGFRVAPEDRAVTLAEEKKIDIRRYDIIYQVTDEIKKAVEGMLIPEIKEVHLGRAVVRQLFKISKVGTVAGCFVTQGLIERSSKARVLRDGREIYKSSIEALKRFKDDVKEVRENFECGIKIVNFDDLKPDDVIEAYRVDVIRRTL